VGLAIFREGTKVAKGRILKHGFHGWARMVERVESMAFLFSIFDFDFDFELAGTGVDFEQEATEWAGN
jgi:hypothetical protein